MALMNRKDNAPLMMPISEKYSDMGTVVVGKLESGRIKKGDNLLLMPNKVRLHFDFTDEWSADLDLLRIDPRHDYRDSQRDGG
jgi:translation elongation factor EF-1alpha